MPGAQGCSTAKVAGGQRAASERARTGIWMADKCEDNEWEEALARINSTNANVGEHAFLASDVERAINFTNKSLEHARAMICKAICAEKKSTKDNDDDGDDKSKGDAKNEQYGVYN